MYEGRYRITRESDFIRVLDARPAIDQERRCYLQVRRQELIVLANPQMPVFSVNLIRTLGRYQDGVLTLSQMVKLNKADAERQELPFIEFIKVSEEFLEDLERIVYF